MFDDLATNSVVATNYEPLCDVKILMGLTYIYVATTKMDYVAFCFNQYFYMMHKTNKCTRAVSMFIEEDYAIACQDVKN